MRCQTTDDQFEWVRFNQNSTCRNPDRPAKRSRIPPASQRRFIIGSALWPASEDRIAPPPAWEKCGEFARNGPSNLGVLDVRCVATDWMRARTKDCPEIACALRCLWPPAVRSSRIQSTCDASKCSEYLSKESRKSLPATRALWRSPGHLRRLIERTVARAFPSWLHEFHVLWNVLLPPTRRP